MLKVGVDSYSLDPLNMEPLDFVQWVADAGGQGMQFSGLTPEQSKKVDQAYLRDLKALVDSLDLFIQWGGGQHIPRDMESWEEKDLFEVNRKAAEEAAILGTRIVRSCSGGLMRWNPDNLATEILLQETAQCLRAQKRMLIDHNVLLSIETHFEFTTFELLRLLEMCETEPGEYLGICLDTMNLLIMLEDPVCATERILPWITSTHVKDGALLLNKEGLIAFPLEIGKGLVDFKRIAGLLESQSSDIHLVIEDHGGSFNLPIFDPRFLSEFPDLTAQEFAQLLSIAQKAAVMNEDPDWGVTERPDWPLICEAQVRKDIQSMKEIVHLK